MFTASKTDDFIFTVLLLFVAISLLIIYYMRKYRRKTIVVPDIIKVEVITDDIFSTLEFEFTQMHQIAKPMIIAAKYIILLIKPSKTSQDECFILNTLKNDIKKEYCGNWDNNKKSNNYRWFIKKMTELLERGCVTLNKSGVQMQKDNIQVQCFLTLSIRNDIVLMNNIFVVPFIGYKHKHNSDFLIHSLVCDDYQNVIGICSVGNEAINDIHPKPTTVNVPGLSRQNFEHS